MATLNNNNIGIKLSYEASYSSIHFLDLEISAFDKQLVTKTFFKATDRNGYIPVDSCHHAVWLKSVPRNQLLRIRRNCTDLSDFYYQVDILKSRFVDKGYQSSLIDDEINKISLADRDSLTREQPKRVQDSKHRWSFLTTFSIHRQIKDIFRKHWKVLKSDQILGPTIPDNAGVIYRGALPLSGQITPNVIDPPIAPVFFQNLKGYYPCRKCRVCAHNTCGRKKKMCLNLLLHH